MTPLAHRIVKELTLPLKRRSFVDTAGLLGRMDGVHCFDMTEVGQIISDLSDNIVDRGICDARTSFLPAPKTWIEFGAASFRMGWLLEKKENHFIGVTAAYEGGQFGSLDQGVMRLAEVDQPNMVSIAGDKMQDLILASLAIINTPRIIGRRQHMPHRGLERKLVAHKAMIGKFPLNAWTEIRLHVTPPRDASGDGSHEAHLTGERALHFCRAHLRIRLGRLEIVKAHWRGDPSLGIRQSRYKLAA